MITDSEFKTCFGCDPQHRDVLGSDCTAHLKSRRWSYIVFRKPKSRDVMLRDWLCDWLARVHTNIDPVSLAHQRRAGARQGILGLYLPIKNMGCMDRARFIMCD